MTCTCAKLTAWLRLGLLGSLLALAGCGGGVSTVQNPGAPPVPTGVSANATSPTSVTVTWTASTDATSYSVLRDGASIATSASTTYIDSTAAAATTYHYSVAAISSAGLTSAASATVDVTTPPAIPAPPTGLQAVALDSTSASLSWTAAAGATGYVVWRDGAALTSGATTAATSYTDAGLQAATTYTYTLQSVNGTGSSAQSAAVTVTTNAATLPPAAPTALNVATVTTTSVTLNWTTAAAGTNGIGGYYVYRNGSATPVATVTSGTAYTDSGLSAATSYTYQVAAFDKTAPTPLVSAQSAAVTAMTAPVVAGPGAPNGLTAAVISSSSLALSWTAAAAGTNGIGGYYIYRNGGTTPVATVTSGTAYTDTGLTAATSYSYQVAAFDRTTPTPLVSPLVSPLSSAATAQTSGVAPAAPAGLTATPASSSSITLSWPAATAGSNGIGGYYVYRNSGKTPIATITSGTTYTDTGLTAATSYSYQVAAFDRTTPVPLVSPLSPTATAQTSAVAPAAPAGLTATAASSSSIGLSWSAATAGSNGIGGYYVYRNGGATPVATITSGTTYTDTGLTVATSYSYQVAAFDRTTPTPLVSPLSATATAQTSAVPPAAPTGLTATAASSSSIGLSWSASTAGSNGIGGYYVYRNGGATPVATVTSGTAYTDTGLTGSTSYSYQVAAFDRSTPTPVVSPLSSSASATTTSGLPTTPATPTGLSALASSNTNVNLTWNAVGPTQTGAVTYLIYRNDHGLVAIGNSSTPSYSDSTALQATAYSYTVQAQDSAGHTSAQSAAATVTTPGPTTPAGLAASPTTSGIALTWTAASDTLGVSGYRVYRNGTVLPASILTNAYTDTTASQAQTYTYTVQAIDGSGYQSAQSTSASATAYGPTSPTLNVSGTTTNSVSLTWTAATDSYGLGGYRLYRGTTSGSITTLIASVTSATTSYTDGAFSSVGTYYYQVVAFDTAPAPGPFTGASASVSANITSTTPIVIAPRHAALTLSQTQQYTATVGGSTVSGAITWSVDGATGGNSTVGTISATGLYTPPSTAGNHTISATSGGDSSVTPATVAVTDLGGIYTYHSDNARTGQNLQEYALTATTVAPANFGKLFTCTVDGDVYAQPVYVANLAIGGGTHNVVFVVTMHNTVYAFDADSAPCVTYWQTPYATGTVTSVPAVDVTCSDDVHTEYGITGTPVVDPAAKVIYFVTKTKELVSGTTYAYYQRLHALDLATGTEKSNSPATIAASVATSGGTLNFKPLSHNQRAGLALANGKVYVAWASHCDVPSWHGWLIAYDSTSLMQTNVFVSTPTGTYGGIWMSGGAPAIDSSSNLYVTTGNGSFDPTTAVITPYAPGNNYGESYLKLSGALAVVDFYTPSDNADWTTNDLDLSASGVTVIPDGAGSLAHPNIVVGSDKQGHLWALDRSGQSGAATSTMGAFSPASDNVVSYQSLPYNAAKACAGLAMQGTPTYWNGTVYAATTGGPIFAIPMANITTVAGGGATPPTVATSAATSDSYQYPTPTAAISSAPGAASAILWTLDNNANGTDNCYTAAGPAILRAYDATTLTKLYDSKLQPSRDTAGGASNPAIKFQPPVVANGHVYVAVSKQLVVFGLLP